MKENQSDGNMAVCLRIPKSLLQEDSYCIKLMTPVPGHHIVLSTTKNAKVSAVIQEKEKELVRCEADSLFGIWSGLKTELHDYTLKIMPAQDGVAVCYLESIDTSAPCEAWAIEEHPTIEGIAPTYKAKVVIPRSLMEMVESYLSAASEDEYQGEDNTITVTLKTPDGYEIDLKCCGCRDAASWTEAVLFLFGSEECCTEPEGEFDGEWELESLTASYELNVVKSETEEDAITVAPYDAATPCVGWSVAT